MASSVNSRRKVLGCHQGHILLDQTGFGLRQDPPEIILAQRSQLHPDRQTSLQFRQQVGWLGDVKRARRDKQNVIGLHRPVFGCDRGAFDQRQQIALHAFAGNAGSHSALAGCDLVDFIDKDDAVILRGLQGFLVDLLHVQQLVGLVIEQ
jgi:hypothetical protein